MKHTVEPWEVSQDTNINCATGADIDDSDDWRIAACEGSLFDRPSDEREANAARIVACVNGCVVIPNPEILGEFLKASKNFLNGCGWYENNQHFDDDDSVRLAYAIAKIEGNHNESTRLALVIAEIEGG